MVTLHCCKRPHSLKAQCKYPPKNPQRRKIYSLKLFIPTAGIAVASRLDTQQLGMCLFVSYASIAITSLVRKNKTNEDHLEDAKERDQQDQEGLAQKIQWDLERENSYRERTEDIKVEKTEAG